MAAWTSSPALHPWAARLVLLGVVAVAILRRR
jgi:hypothetical protein